MVNDCRARFVCLSRETRTVTNKLTDQIATFKAAARVLNIAPSCPTPSMILRNMSAQDLQNYASRHSSVKTNNETNGITTMKNKTNKAVKAKKIQPKNKTNKGLNEHIISLREKGMKQEDAFNATLPLWYCSRAGFNGVWNRKPKAVKPAKAAKSKATAKAPAKKVGGKTVSAKAAKPAVPTRKPKATVPVKPVVPVRQAVEAVEAGAEVAAPATE